MAIPLVDDGSDLWIESRTGVSRIQVKYASKKEKGYRDKWRLSAGGRGRPLSEYQASADFFIVVHPNLTDCWIVSTSDISAKTNTHLNGRDVNAWVLLGEPRTPPESQETEEDDCQLAMCESLAYDSSPFPALRESGP